jgi:hypothetical protein
MQEVEFRLTGDRLTHNNATRVLTGADQDGFVAWIARYHDLAWQAGNNDALLVLGQEIRTWLDGDEQWLATLGDNLDSPVVAAFAVSGTATGADRRFLEVPWELAATGDGFLAADPAMMWAPLRRIGATVVPPPPDPRHRLG